MNWFSCSFSVISLRIRHQPCIYGPFSIADWKLGALGYKRYTCPTCVPYNYCLHPHKSFSMSSNVTAANTYSVDTYSVCVYYLFNNGCLILITWKIMLQFACNPLITFDDDLKHDFAFAWSLPPPPYLWEEDGEHQSSHWWGSGIWSMGLSKVLDFQFRVQDWWHSLSESSIFEAFSSKLTS